MPKQTYANDDERPQNPGSSCITRGQWRAKLDAFDNRCAYCGTRERKLCIEHVETMCRGGEDVIDNIVPACLSCNSTKRHAFLLEWVWSQHGLLCVQPAAGAMRVRRDGEKVTHPSTHLSQSEWAGPLYIYGVYYGNMYHVARQLRDRAAAHLRSAGSHA